MARKRDYKVYTLNGKEMLKMAANKDRNWYFDLGSEYDRVRIVEYEKLYAESALFYQILRAAKAKPEDWTKVLTTKIVYIHFDGGVSDIEKKTRNLLEDGFMLRFRGQEDFSRFVPFDKSASMSRKNVISFIAEDVYETVDRSLDLGLDFTDENPDKEFLRKAEIVPSKYYAYRGLYMTDGIRLSPFSMPLDHRSVIVIRSGKFSVFAESMTVNSKAVNGKIIVSPDKIKREEEFEITPFDGEGLIDREYARLINKMAGYKDGEGATSFQIRMPFTKGMLHTVDFKQFLADQFPTEDINTLTITDIYDKERRIADAKIILTDSMFKCDKWLKASPLCQPDPMEWYFDCFEKYDHAMYLVSSDADFRTDETVRMNYQFINTLDMGKESFEKMVGRHIERAREITADPYCGRDILLGTEDGYEDETQSGDMGDWENKGMESWEYALRSNIAFVEDPMIKKKLDKMRTSMTMDVRRGRLVVPGSLKYLSGDLLHLLVVIAKYCFMKTDKTTGKWPELDKKTGKYPVDAFKKTVRDRDQVEGNITSLEQHSTLYADKFYLAGTRSYKLDENKYYTILRSPHLSRNEQCMLMPLRLKIYNRYFSHLKGVIMVSTKSSAPAVLGGADFDGDTVKLIRDEDINEAVFRGSYKEVTVTREGEEGSVEKTVIRRKLPVVVIDPPKSKSTKKVKKRITYEDLNASFSSNVGQISNIAFVLGKLEYGSSADGTVPEGSTACCTVATGLEIDSVKTGVKPDYSELEKLCNVADDPFLKIDWAFKEINKDPEKKDKMIHGRLDPETGEYVAFQKSMEKIKGGEKKKKGRKTKTIEDELFRIDEEQLCNVDLLPYYYAKELVERKTAKKDSSAAAFAKLPKRRFNFEKENNDWKQLALLDPKSLKLAGIIRAYKELHANNWNYSGAREKNKNEMLKGNVETILFTKYDRGVDKLYVPWTKPTEIVELNDAIEMAYDEIYQRMTTPEDADNVRKKMKDRGWEFAPTWETRAAILGDLFPEEPFSPVVQELLCDTYENCYQYLNYILLDIKQILITKEYDADDTETEMRIEKVKKVKYPYDKQTFKDVYTAIYKCYRNNSDRRTVWSERAGSFCRDAVDALFDGNMSKAIKYTVALEDTADKSHSFLWGVFTAEDMSEVVYVPDKKGEHAEGEQTDAE